MNFFKSGLIVLGSVGLLFLGACGNSNPAANSDASSTGAQPAESASSDGAKKEPSTHAGAFHKGAQVVESAPYHLEFISEKEDNGTRLDFHLLKEENNEEISNAKVTAQIQLPDGSQKTLPMTYGAQEKSYTALLPGKAAGQYQVKITSDIGGKKVDGRFSFKQ
ncbi:MULTISPECIES: hypothetical protein [unclassified Microcoleus]|uniref:hypothetical protein n=1 Tax=unclassified Microcoleus TaxID=2642155 RepID=UPI002FD757D3